MKRIHGIAASPGIAIGPAFLYRPATLTIPRRTSDDSDEEWARWQRAAEQALLELRALREKTRLEAGEAEAAIFDAHQMLVQDPELEDQIRQAVRRGASAEAAVELAVATNAAAFDAMDDALFRERAADIRDVGRRLLRALLGIGEEVLPALDRPAIVVAHDLMPSDTAGLDKSKVLGFCTAGGGRLSHTAILARNLGLPAVVGAGEALEEIADGERVILDGTSGQVLLGADDEVRATYEREAREWASARVLAANAAAEPAITRDGRRVEVVANIGLPGEETQALLAGAEGIGLLRTEFLFVERAAPPSEAEQVLAYRQILQAMRPRPTIARTLDIGGDKPAAFLSMPREDNPFLGWRAIRIGLDRPEFLKTQLRALLRAGHGCNLKIMFPMIATVEEMRAARRLVDEARAELAAEGQPMAEALEVGAMVEVPSAAVLADRLATLVDFFSIGSNDLTQYTLAADRGNPALASLFDSMHPAVLRLVDGVIRAAHAAGIWVGMCGELAGELSAIPVLLGLGLDEFSMGPAAVPSAKALIRKLSAEETRALAREALDQPGAPAVRELVARWMAERTLP